MESKEPQFENQKFKTVLIDPPWMEVGGGKIKRGADKYKRLMKTNEIIYESKMHLDLIETNAHLYVWVTNNFLKDGLRLIEELGFAYKTNIVWNKRKAGLGQYFRGHHQLCLFAIRGNGYSVRSANKSLTTQLGGGIIPATTHSKKPDEIYTLIENRSLGPYLELFTNFSSINARNNWSSIII
jgi:N6-adenosine-specific RNA methylase IME4